jgi:LAS superfamily LD-carboxypeptidase LdcB
MTSSNKASDMSAQKSDNPLPSVNELSPYTKAEFEILKLAAQGHSLKATAALLGQSEDQVALETHEDWYAASIDPTDICRRAIRVFKELTASEKSKMAAADSRKCLRKFWGKASKRYNDTQVDIH